MNAKQRQYTIEALKRYWPNTQELVKTLPSSERHRPATHDLPPKLKEVAVPDWGKDLGVNGKFLVPHWAGDRWDEIDWLEVVFWYLNGEAERAHERRWGPIHSYAYRLKGWDSRVWERAWVNRMALFIRRWLARVRERREEELFGVLPAAEIVFTHDVDAVSKTLAIRFKQTIFHCINALRALARNQPVVAGEKLAKTIRVLCSRDDYWCFDTITSLEQKHGVRSHFNFYGGPGGWSRSLTQLLLDPAYCVEDDRLNHRIKRLHEHERMGIGLHPSYHAWSDADAMRLEKQRLETAIGLKITSCRQHWLRFGWEQTWQAQQAAGFELDSTLGFNDRPGFRNGAALLFHPWDQQTAGPMQLQALPLVLMDSHLYDYDLLTKGERTRSMRRWIDEIRLVRGQATVVWHQRVMSKDYGWDEGYKNLLRHAVVAG